MRGPTILVFGLAVALAAAGCSDDGGERRPSRPPSDRPSIITAPATSTPAVGDALTRAGTRLIAPAEPETRQIDAESACRTFLTQPEGACEIVRMAGGNALWTVEADPGLVDADERRWRVRVWVRSRAMPDGGWQVARMLPEGARAPSYAQVSATTADVTGDGLPEVLVGYRSGGTGQFESYDVLTFAPRETLRVAFHRGGLHKGSVTIDGTRIVDYSAGESSPERTTRTTIGFDKGTFRIDALDDLPIDAQPPDLFA